MAGIVAADHNTMGVAGVCPECTILDAKVLNDNGSGSTSADRQRHRLGRRNGAKVINMSLGQRVSSRTLEAAVNNAWNPGVVIVAAAGNAGTQAKIYPGAYPNVIAVAATDNKDNKASFSTYGKWVDVAAPGVNVYSTFPYHPFVLGTQNDRAHGLRHRQRHVDGVPDRGAIAALVWSAEADATNERSGKRSKKPPRNRRHRHQLGARPRERARRRQAAGALTRREFVVGGVRLGDAD